MSSQPLLFLYCLACVHQEDCSYLFLLKVPCPIDRCCSCTTLLVSTKRTAALPWQGPDHCSRTCSLTHCQCPHNILIAIVIYLAAFWLLKSLDYSGRAIQVHTLERAIQVHTQERAIQVHTQERAILVHGILVHHYVLSCTTRTRALLRNLMHYSCTATYSRASISCTTRTRAPISCTTPTRAPLILVHHSALVHCSVISCTTRAPLCTLMHPSRAPLILMHQSRAPLLLVHHSFSCTTPYSSTAP